MAAITAVASGASAAPSAPAKSVVEQLAVDAKARAAQVDTPEANDLAKNLDDLLKQVPAAGGPADILKKIIDALLKLLGLNPPSQAGHQLSGAAAGDPADPYLAIVKGLVGATGERADALPAGDRKDEATELLDQVRAEVAACLAADGADSDVDCASAVPDLPGEIERAVTLTAPPAGHAQ